MSEAFATRVSRLGRLDPRRELFGAGSHDYALGECLAPTAIRDLEARYGVTLPSDFRRFLETTGNGGAGPGYGLVALARSDDEMWRFPALAQDPRFPGFARPSDPARPFAFTETFRPPPQIEGWTISRDAHPLDGCLRLNDLGCGFCHFLVVTGRAAGQVWIDNSDSGGDVAPIARDFDGYYTEWLDEATLENAARRARAEAPYSANQDEDVTGAIALGEEMLARRPGSIKVHDELAALLIYGCKVPEALAVIERGKALPDGLVPLSITLALLEGLMDKHADVVATVDRALATHPTYSGFREALFWAKARSLLALGRGAEAVDAAREALTEGYYLVRNQIDFFVLAVQAGEQARADAAIDEFIEASRADKTLAERRSEVYAIVVEAATAYELTEVAAAYRRKLG
jgi:hypothetical protein